MNEEKSINHPAAATEAQYVAPAIDKMYAEGNISGKDLNTRNSPDGKFLPGKTVEKGKVYHTYMT